jgi:hypothetical protein
VRLGCSKCPVFGSEWTPVGPKLSAAKNERVLLTLIAAVSRTIPATSGLGSRQSIADLGCKRIRPRCVNALARGIFAYNPKLGEAPEGIQKQ